MGRALACGRAGLLLRIALLGGLLGPHFFHLAHVFGFHVLSMTHSGRIKRVRKRDGCLLELGTSLSRAEQK